MTHEVFYFAKSLPLSRIGEIGIFILYKGIGGKIILDATLHQSRAISRKQTSQHLLLFTTKLHFITSRKLSKCKYMNYILLKILQDPSPQNCVTQTGFSFFSVSKNYRFLSFFFILNVAFSNLTLKFSESRPKWGTFNLNIQISVSSS